MPRAPLFDKPMTPAERQAKKRTARLMLIEDALACLAEAQASLDGDGAPDDLEEARAQIAAAVQAIQDLR